MFQELLYALGWVSAHFACIYESFFVLLHKGTKGQEFRRINKNTVCAFWPNVIHLRATLCYETQNPLFRKIIYTRRLMETDIFCLLSAWRVSGQWRRWPSPGVPVSPSTSPGSTPGRGKSGPSSSAAKTSTLITISVFRSTWIFYQLRRTPAGRTLAKTCGKCSRNVLGLFLVVSLRRNTNILLTSSSSTSEQQLSPWRTFVPLPRNPH